MKRKIKFIFFFLFLFALISCRRDDLSIKHIVFQPYVRAIEVEYEDLDLLPAEKTPEVSTSSDIAEKNEQEESSVESAESIIVADVDVSKTGIVLPDAENSNAADIRKTVTEISMGLSVYVTANVPDVSKASMELVSPDETLRWNFIPKSVSYNGATYYGTSSVTMPLGCLLPQGLWKLSLIYKDGRSAEQTFKVYYNDADIFSELVSDKKKPFFSSLTNLTYIP